MLQWCYRVPVLVTFVGSPRCQVSRSPIQVLIAKYVAKPWKSQSLYQRRQKRRLPLLAICLFCGCFIVFVCLSLWCWGLNVDLTVSVSEFSYLGSDCIGSWVLLFTFHRKAIEIIYIPIPLAALQWGYFFKFWKNRMGLGEKVWIGLQLPVQ